MELTLWTYEGPPHVGAMRVANSMRDLHFVLHAPQGDTYADLLFTMIERNQKRPPVTYTTFQARDLGADTASIFKNACEEANERFKPSALLVGASCTAELIQDDPMGLAKALDMEIPVVGVELLAYQRKENWGASETFYQLVRTLASPFRPAPGETRERRPGAAPCCNILGPTSLGFRNRDDVTEVVKLLESLGVEINLIAPLGASPEDLTHIGEADFNVVLYPEVAGTAARWLERNFRQPMTKTVPIGVGATRDFILEVCEIAGLEPPRDEEDSRLPWYSRSIDSTYLTGKRVFVFGDATHAIAAARIAQEEMGFEVVALGSYSREQAREVREAAEALGLEALITDDYLYLEVEAKVQELQPELILGTQMERHIAKRQGVPCAVISSPVHVQDFPARYSPQMGHEGANVIFDTWVHPLMMGLEEHLLRMFQEDFEFADGAAPSHLASEHGRAVERADPRPVAAAEAPESDDQTGAQAETAGLLAWDDEAERELKRIPFFVRGKARRNTELFAAERGLNPITVETLYDAKAHFSR